MTGIHLSDYLAITGLWVILICSPFVRHLVWWFSSKGRRAKSDLVPMWTRMDFEDYLLGGGWFANVVLKLISCAACQSMHAAIIHSAFQLRFSTFSLWATVYQWLILTAFYYVTFKVISKL